jgi:Ca2+-binding RTX toxin-like protein
MKNSVLGYEHLNKYFSGAFTMANLTIDLSNAKSDLGMFITPDDLGSTGFSFNRDNYDDIIFYEEGKFSVFFGKDTGWQYPLDSAKLNGNNGFTVNTSSFPMVYDLYDTNGTKLTDNIILEDEGKKIYVLFGKAGEWQSPIDFSNIASLSNSLVINPESGKSVRFERIDNFDGDNNYNDFVLRTDNYDSYYVVFGNNLVNKSVINLSNLNGTNGFVIKGTDGRYLESLYGDFNNDQISDMTVTDINKTYVVFGKEPGGEAEVDLSNLNGNNGFVINGSGYFQNMSEMDFNNDGKKDMILADSNTFDKYYVVFNQDQWDAEINLATLDGKNGFTINSVQEGLSLWSLNDINSDGKQDIVLFNGANKYTVLFNKGSNWSSSVDLANLSSEDGLTIFNSSGSEYESFYPELGINLDINNDGKQDFSFTGNNTTDGSFSKTYVLFGPLTGNSIDLSKLNGSDGFVINNSISNSSVSYSSLYPVNNNIQKDINGDNIDDLILGQYDGNTRIKYHVISGKSATWQSSINVSQLENSDDLLFIGNQANSDLLGDESYTIGENDNYSSYNLLTDKGKLYAVISNPENGLQFPVDLSNLNGENGFVINIGGNERPILNHYSYYLDFNNDNNQDISFHANGKQYVIFSQLTGWQPAINVSELDGSNGFVITNGDQLLPLGSLSTITIGDLNKDGKQDLTFHETNYNLDGSVIDGPSKMYISLSQETGWDAEIDLSELDGQNGFVINTQRYTNIISTDQDINGDKINDLVLNDSQNAYVIFGKSASWDAEIDLANLGDNGFVIDIKDLPEDYYEISVEKVNNDNISDLWINLLSSNDNSGDYILFGSPDITKNGTLSTSTNYTLQATEQNLTLTGTENILAVGNSLPNEIQGNSGDNVIQGMEGDDQLNGSNGNDNVQGGEGDDTLSDVLKPPTNIPNTRTTENTIENNDRMIGGLGKDEIKSGYANDSLYGQEGDDTLHGQLDHDKLFGGASNDVLLGGQGRDQINGNAGDDILTGGASKDKFIFNTNAPFTKESLGLDEITDFQLDMDKIVLDRQTFTELSTSSDNILKPDEFAQVTNINQAGTSEVMIVYNTTNGALYYNPNGVATGFGIGGQFAILTNIPELQNTDFLIRG